MDEHHDEGNAEDIGRPPRADERRPGDDESGPPSTEDPGADGDPDSTAAPREDRAGEHGEDSAGLPRAQRALLRAVHGAGDVVGTVESAGRRVGELTMPVLRPVVRRVRPRMGAAARRWRNREAARRARLRALNREPLPNLYDVHPAARLAPVRELGLQAIPVADIRGTAVEGAVQRGRDFLPPPPLRTQNWVARWQRIRKALDNLAVLPPIEVLKADGAYWVVDGHNRVGAALYGNQVAIDALVSAVRLRGDPIEVPGSLASMLGQIDELDGVGRFVPRTSFERPPLPSQAVERSQPSPERAEPAPPREPVEPLSADGQQHDQPQGTNAQPPSDGPTDPPMPR